MAIYNLALNDYCSPIEEFVKFIDLAENRQSSSETGHTMLMYLHSSLDGLDMDGEVRFYDLEKLSYFTFPVHLQLTLFAFCLRT